MFSRQLDQLARERHADRAAQTARAHSTKATSTGRPPTIRSQTGWAIVSIGLRIAASGNR
jgi:hypothetical protein